MTSQCRPQEWHFTRSGDEEVGLYQSLSLYRLVFDFKTQKLAPIESTRRFNMLLKPPAHEGLAQSNKTKPEKTSRRAFFSGRTSGAGGVRAGSHA